jgi:hypothetical protein
VEGEGENRALTYRTVHQKVRRMKLMPILAVLAALASAPLAVAQSPVGERPFDAAQWPKTLAEGSNDLTRKAMVRSLIESGWLMGRTKAEVEALLGRSETDGRLMWYPLGEGPVGGFNPVVLGLMLDDSQRVIGVEAAFGG